MPVRPEITRRVLSQLEPDEENDPNTADGPAIGQPHVNENRNQSSQTAKEHLAQGAVSAVSALSGADPLDPAAFHGLAGEIVRTIDPQTEADPAAILIQLLVATGVMAGRTAYYEVEATRHHLNLFAVLVGDTSKSRKGTSLSHVRELCRLVEPTWTKQESHGLSSGEGLIEAVRDPTFKPVTDKKTGVSSMELIDPGVEDKRLLVVESEFSTPLKMSARVGNTLTDQVRLAYDGDDLRNMTVAGRRATGPHIGIVGHITRDELRRYMDATELANGLANRFIWIRVRRSKVLPFGGRLDAAQLAHYAGLLREVMLFARRCGRLAFGDAAAAMWVRVYPSLSEGRPGLLGAVLGRAEAHVVRLASLYAMLDRSSMIGPEHLRAALAIWEYSERSAAHIWGDALGDPIADSILSALRQRGDVMTRLEIRNLFSGHGGSKVQQALDGLLAVGLVTLQKVPTAGRPEERWRAV